MVDERPWNFKGQHVEKLAVSLLWKMRWEKRALSSPLSRKQIVVNSETDWAEPWAHKFTLRAWKPIVTSRSRHSWWWLRFNGAAHLENNDKLILIWFYFCKQLLFLFFRWSRRKIPGKLLLYCISKWSCWRVLWESVFVKTPVRRHLVHCCTLSLCW